VVVARGVQENYNRRGVVLMSTPQFVVHLLAYGLEVLHQFDYLYADETHERDASTYLIRNIAGLLVDHVKVIYASASHPGGDWRQPEGCRAIMDYKYEHQPIRDWDVAARSRLPWSAEMVRDSGNTLIFSDDASACRNLIAAYKDQGFIVHYLTAISASAEVVGVIKQLDTMRAHVHVVICDNSYRTGFNFDVGTVIDTGLVNEIAVADGAPYFEVRTVNCTERYQARGRLGRISSTKPANYYLPDLQFTAPEYDLASAEIDIAAVLFRILGLRPPVELQASKFFSLHQPLPRDILTALNSPVPLALCEVDDGFADSIRSQFMPSDEVIDDAYFSNTFARLLQTKKNARYACRAFDRVHMF